jgi:hypothetical protein
MQIIKRRASLAGSSLLFALTDLRRNGAVRHDGESLLEAFKVIGTDQHCGRFAVPRNDNTILLTLNPINQLGEPGLYRR